MDDAAPVDYGKMVVCVAPEAGYFFRINSKQWRVPVELLKADHPEFLDRDSFLQCSPPLDVDDYTIEQFLDSNGGRPLGTVLAKYIPAIWAAVAGNPLISKADKEIIGIELGVI